MKVIELMDIVQFEGHELDECGTADLSLDLRVDVNGQEYVIIIEGEVEYSCDYDGGDRWTPPHTTVTKKKPKATDVTIYKDDIEVPMFNVPLTYKIADDYLEMYCV